MNKIIDIIYNFCLFWVELFPDHNYTELVSLHKKAFGSYDSYIDLRKLANIRQEYFNYIDKLLNIGKYPNIPTL